MDALTNNHTSTSGPTISDMNSSGPTTSDMNASGQTTNDRNIGRPTTSDVNTSGPTAADMNTRAPITNGLNTSVTSDMNTREPMTEAFHSAMNFGFANSYYTPALVLGGLQAEGEFRSIRDVICHYHDGKGSCFKGKNCLRKHPVEPTSNTCNSSTSTIPGRTIIFASKLPPTLKHEPKKNIQFLGKVVHVVSPLEFYIIPKRYIACLCGRCDDDNVTGEEFNGTGEGLYGMNEFHTMLEKFMNAKKRGFQLPEYQKFQLVAVRHKKSSVGMEPIDQSYWYRATVLDEVKYNTDDPFACPFVRARLVDFGIVVQVPLDEVASLPPRFTSVPPMCFRCELDGVIPVGANFSTEAVEFFRDQVMNTEMFIKYKGRKMSHREENPNDLRDKFLYSVELVKKEFTSKDLGNKENVQNADEFEFSYASLRQRPLDASGIFTTELAATREQKRRAQIDAEASVAHQNITAMLHDRGYCLAAHPFPYRPMILNGGFDNLSLTGALLLSLESTSLQKDDFDELMQAEKNRIVRVVNAINMGSQDASKTRPPANNIRSENRRDPSHVNANSLRSEDSTTPAPADVNNIVSDAPTTVPVGVNSIVSNAPTTAVVNANNMGSDAATTMVVNANNTGSDAATTAVVNANNMGSDAATTMVVNANNTGSDAATTAVVNANNTGSDAATTAVVNVNNIGSDTPTIALVNVNNDRGSGYTTTPSPPELDPRTLRVEFPKSFAQAGFSFLPPRYQHPTGEEANPRQSVRQNRIRIAYPVADDLSEDDDYVYDDSM